MWMRKWVFWSLVMHFLYAQDSTGAEELNEELWIRPLPFLVQPRVATQFRFTIESRQSDMHYTLFPKSIGQIMEKYQISELKLSLSSGIWDNVKWGEFLHEGLGPFGAELWAKVDGENKKHKWDGLRAEIGAMFSVSMGLLKEDLTIYPKPQFIAPYLYDGILHNSTEDDTVFYGVLPKEEVCTENLTPWLKLLTCRKHSGLGHLIDTIRMAGSDYYSISMHAKRTGTKMILSQTLTNVLRTEKKDWSVLSLMGSSDLEACPLAKRSMIYVEVPKLSWLAIAPTSSFTLDKNWHQKQLKEVAVYDLKSTKADFKLPLLNPQLERTVTAQDRIKVHRYLTGYGQVRGGFAIIIENNDEDQARIITYHDHFPWFMRIYFHTLRVSINGVEINPTKEFHIFNFRPAEEHGHPNLLNFVTKLQPKTKLLLSAQYEKVFLLLAEYPPDANRGSDIPSAVAVFYPESAESRDATRSTIPAELSWSLLVQQLHSDNAPFTMYTRPMIVQLPTPDFSMPYNVITLTSTVIAFFLGTLLNVLLRRKRGTRLEAAKTEQQNFGLSKKDRILRFFKIKTPERLHED